MDVFQSRKYHNFDNAMSGLKSFKSRNLSQSTSSKHIASSVRSSMTSSKAKSFLSKSPCIILDIKYPTKASSLPKTYWKFLKSFYNQHSFSCWGIPQGPKGPRIWDRKIWPWLDSPDTAKKIVIFRPRNCVKNASFASDWCTACLYSLFDDIL